MENKITWEFLVADNGEGYDQNDNRTHKGTLLGDSPYLDLLAHMSFPKDGKGLSISVHTPIGSFCGNAHEEMMKKAENKVFHFPPASSLKLDSFVSKGKVTKIQDIRFSTLMPSSMIERYNIKGKVTYTQKTPIYYDVGTSKFFLLMDERLLQDRTYDEIVPKGIKNVAVYRDNKRNIKLLAITGDTIADLKNNMSEKEGTFDLIFQQYKNLFLLMEGGERVIVLKYQTESDDELGERSSNQFRIPNFSDNKEVAGLIMRQQMSLEIFQAAQIRDMFYLMNEEGEIHPKAILHFRKEETDPEYEKSSHMGEGLGNLRLTHGGKTYLVLPYTDEDWLFIKSLQERMIKLCKELDSFFMSTKTEVGKLDKPFSEGIMPSLGSNLLDFKE